ncbi:MAG: S24 family peptidase, partial [Planctomycetota bacterium]|nr:S24 family peptidase [Planctomycetota bacterium]
MSAIAKELEVASEAQIRRFKNGYQSEMQALVELGKRGVSLMYLLSGEDNGPPPPNAARVREPVNFVLNAKAIPVVGEAAADETQGQKAGFLPPDPETRYDELHFPESTAAVRIIGDSMAPVLLGGQYALIGPEYLGKFDNPKSHEIVVADVEIRDDDQASSDARWTGTYCKRIVDGGDVWVFLSIAPTGVPFRARAQYIRFELNNSSGYSVDSKGEIHYVREAAATFHALI